MLYITKPKYRDVVLIPNPFFFFPSVEKCSIFQTKHLGQKRFTCFFYLLVFWMLKKKQKTEKRQQCRYYV